MAFLQCKAGEGEDRNARHFLVHHTPSMPFIAVLLTLKDCKGARTRNSFPLIVLTLAKHGSVTKPDIDRNMVVYDAGDGIFCMCLSDI